VLGLLTPFTGIISGMIQHILFDADGVLIHGEMFSLEVQRKYGVPQEKMREFYRGVFLESLGGKADLKEIIEPYLKEWGWPKAVDDYLNEWFAYEHVLDQEITDYIQKLRKLGMKCYVATNQEKYRAQYMLDKMGFKDSFDKLYASAHLGVQKPDIQFFQKVLDDIKANKDEVLFWDDSEENVVAAKKFGINSEYFDTFENFKRIMKDKYEIQG
jgi:putative hydrolase of the HAD superfamily